MSCPCLCSTLFTAVHKRPAEGGLGAFCFLPVAFALEVFWGLWLDFFAFGFLVWEAFGREKNYWREKNCGETAEGKRMAKEGLIESLH
jgi:hypothetical protein